MYSDLPLKKRIIKRYSNDNSNYDNNNDKKDLNNNDNLSEECDSHVCSNKKVRKTSELTLHVKCSQVITSHTTNGQDHHPNDNECKFRHRHYSQSSTDSGFCDEKSPLDLSFQKVFVFNANKDSEIRDLNEKNNENNIISIISESDNNSNSSITSNIRISGSKNFIESECKQCKKKFTNRIRYRAHVRRHESKNTGRYQCTICYKTFVQRSSLTTHTRIHSGERPFECENCDEKFGDYSTYTKHKRTHTGEKPYACPICQRAFSQSGNMHRHLKAIHTIES